MDIQEIKLECLQIQKFQEARLPDEMYALVEHSKDIMVHKSRIAFLKSAVDAYYFQSKSKIAELMIDANYMRLSAKERNAYIDSVGYEYKALLTWLDRMDSWCTHAVDLIRSMMSKEKAEMQMAAYGGGGA